MSFLWLIHSVFAEQVGVVAPTTPLPISSDGGISVVIKREIEKEVAIQLEIPREDVSVEYLGLANARKCNDADHVSVRIPVSEDFRGSVLVFVTAETEGQICGQWNLQTRMEIWQEISVASESISIGEDIVTSSKKIRREQLRFSAATDLENKIARVPIKKGEVILDSQIREKPDQLRGTTVVVVYKNGNLEIRTEGRLMTDAMVGDDVKVSSQMTNSVLHGILEMDGNVYIEGEK